MKFPIYLDSHATTAVDPEVLKVMLPCFTEIYGNAASRNHEFGWTAEAMVERAREQVARLISASEKEIVFTGGATESNNLAILGVAEANQTRGNHIITSQVEHKSVLDLCDVLERRGFRITRLAPDRFGQIHPETLEAAITTETILVSIMTANNEIGTINPIERLGAVCRKAGIFFHTDATQAAGKIPLNVRTGNIDLASLSAHKMYGPKGVGALYIRRRDPRVRILPQMHGGGHERGMRSGTLNVPGIVGFGKACELCETRMKADAERSGQLRDRLWTRIQAGLPDAILNGHPVDRLSHNLNVSIPGVEAEALMLGMKEIAVSGGSACTSATLEPSHVMKAIGTPPDLMHSAIRFGLSRTTVQEEIDYTAERVTEVARKLRDLSPLYNQRKEDPNEHPDH